MNFVSVPAVAAVAAAVVGYAAEVASPSATVDDAVAFSLVEVARHEMTQTTSWTHLNFPRCRRQKCGCRLRVTDWSSLLMMSLCAPPCGVYIAVIALSGLTGPDSLLSLPFVSVAAF